MVDDDKKFKLCKEKFKKLSRDATQKLTSRGWKNFIELLMSHKIQMQRF